MWFTWRNAVGAKRLHLAGDNRVPSSAFSIFYNTLTRQGRGNATRSEGRPQGRRKRRANEYARGRWYFQFHRAWVNEAHEGRREVRATTLRNFTSSPPKLTPTLGTTTTSALVFRRTPFKRGLPRRCTPVRAPPEVPAHYHRWLPGPPRGVCHPQSLPRHIPSGIRRPFRRYGRAASPEIGIAWESRERA